MMPSRKGNKQTRSVLFKSAVHDWLPCVAGDWLVQLFTFDLWAHTRTYTHMHTCTFIFLSSLDTKTINMRAQAPIPDHKAISLRGENILHATVNQRGPRIMYLCAGTPESHQLFIHRHSTTWNKHIHSPYTNTYMFTRHWDNQSIHTFRGGEKQIKYLPIYLSSLRRSLCLLIPEHCFASMGPLLRCIMFICTNNRQKRQTTNLMSQINIWLYHRVIAEAVHQSQKQRLL